MPFAETTINTSPSTTGLLLPRLNIVRLWQPETKFESTHLQDAAASLLLVLNPKQGGAGGVLKDLPHALVRLCRALEVLLGTDLLTDVLSLGRRLASSCYRRYRGYTDLLWGNRLLRGLVKLLNRLLVVTQILLAANKDDGQARAEMQHLRDPLS